MPYKKVLRKITRIFDVFFSRFLLACATLIYRKIFYCFLGVFFGWFFKYDLCMKKLTVLTFISLSVSLLVGCKGNKEISKVYLPFGKLYDSSLVSEGHLELEKNTKEINHRELMSLVGKEQSFALVVYEKDNECACFKDFELSFNKYLYVSNALVYSIEAKEFDGGRDVFGIKIAKGESTVCLFEGGELAYQRVTNGSNDEFLEYKNLAKWIDDRTIVSNMLYVTSSQLDSLFGGDSEFTVGFLRSSCGDCAYVESHLLYEYNKNANNTSYVIDCDLINDNSFKDKYGLTEQSNPDYGYGEGYVPAFVRYSPTKTSSFNEAILDACVYLNDQIDLVDGEYRISKSFYSEERLPLLGFLGNPDPKYLLEGKTIAENEVDLRSNGYSWNKEYSVSFHDEVLKMFLDAYVSIGPSKM